MSDDLTVQVLVYGLTADESLQLEGCLTDPLEVGSTDVAEVTNRGSALLAEVAAIAYTVVLSGLALDYLATVIVRIRRMFGKCTVFDFRNNTLAVSQHSGVGELAGKCIVVGPQGEVTITDDRSHAEILGALTQVTGTQGD